MPEHDQDLARLAALLETRARAGISAAEIADVVLVAWEQIGVALTPIVGSRAVAMLHQRTLHLCAAPQPWLLATSGELPDATDPGALRSLLERQSAADAVVGGTALLQTFLDLLASLVGSSLTERLLRSVWANLLGGPAAKDSPT